MKNLRVKKLQCGGSQKYLKMSVTSSMPNRHFRKYFAVDLTFPHCKKDVHAVTPMKRV